MLTSIDLSAKHDSGWTMQPSVMKNCACHELRKIFSNRQLGLASKDQCYEPNDKPTPWLTMHQLLCELEPRFAGIACSPIPVTTGDHSGSRETWFFIVVFQNVPASTTVQGAFPRRSVGTKTQQNRPSSEGGNPVYLRVQGCTGSLDSRLRGNDGEGV